MATCNTSELLESAKCLSNLNKKELLAIAAQLLCNIAAAGTGVGEVLTGSWDDPNGNIEPTNKNGAALYYKDSETLQFYRWSVIQQLWIGTMTT